MSGLTPESSARFASTLPPAKITIAMIVARCASIKVFQVVTVAAGGIVGSIDYCESKNEQEHHLGLRYAVTKNRCLSIHF